MRAWLLPLLALSGCGSPEPKPSHVEWVVAGQGPVAPLVVAEQQRARSRGQKVLVYVGAGWCEPCRRFHDAVKAGGLDAELGMLRFVEFDLDRDAERLREAGYQSKMIPLIAQPDAEGRATGKQMEGSIKGAGAVAEMTPRLKALLVQP